VSGLAIYFQRKRKRNGMGEEKRIDGAEGGEKGEKGHTRSK